MHIFGDKSKFQNKKFVFLFLTFQVALIFSYSFVIFILILYTKIEKEDDSLSRLQLANQS